MIVLLGGRFFLFLQLIKSYKGNIPCMIEPVMKIESQLETEREESPRGHSPERFFFSDIRYQTGRVPYMTWS